MTETNLSAKYPRAATRSWLELNVRPWLGLTVVMALATLIMGSVQLYRTLQERRLVQSGTVVKAKVQTIGVAKERNAPRDEVQRVVLEFIDPKSGRTVESLGYLPRKPKSQVSLNEILTIRVDPNDPQVWTERSEPVPILLELTVPMLLLPVPIICLGMTLVQRARVKRTLLNGQAKNARIVSIQQSAIAPMSKRIGLVVEDARPSASDAPADANSDSAAVNYSPGKASKLVRYAYWPTSNGPIGTGDSIEVIVVAGSPIVLPSRSYV